MIVAVRNLLDRALSRARLARFLAFGLLLAWSACAGDEPCGATPQRYALERPFEEHACMHVDVGPFETVGARARGGEGPLPELRNTHVAYTVEVPSSGGDRTGSVMFKPRDTGPFAFFIDADAPLSFSGDQGSACPVAEHRVTACPGLKRALYLDLRRKVEYELGFGEKAPANVLVIVEQVPIAEKSP